MKWRSSINRQPARRDRPAAPRPCRPIRKPPPTTSGLKNLPSRPPRPLRRGVAARASLAVAAALASATTTATMGAQTTAAVVTSGTITSTPPPPPPPGPTVAYQILTTGPYSTSLGTSTVPYLTGAFAGSGAFTVSPIEGYHAGGYNPGTTTPNTTSRLFQAGLSVTGAGVDQSTTFFVMTSIINTSSPLGATLGGGFDAWRVANHGSREYEFTSASSGGVGSTQSSSNTNSVPTNSDGVPVGAFTLYNADTNLNTNSAPRRQRHLSPLSKAPTPSTRLRLRRPQRRPSITPISRCKATPAGSSSPTISIPRDPLAPYFRVI